MRNRFFALLTAGVAVLHPALGAEAKCDIEAALATLRPAQISYNPPTVISAEAKKQLAELREDWENQIRSDSIKGQDAISSTAIEIIRISLVSDWETYQAAEEGYRWWLGVLRSAYERNIWRNPGTLREGLTIFTQRWAPSNPEETLAFIRDVRTDSFVVNDQDDRKLWAWSLDACISVIAANLPPDDTGEKTRNGLFEERLALCCESGNLALQISLARALYAAGFPSKAQAILETLRAKITPEKKVTFDCLDFNIALFANGDRIRAQRILNILPPLDPDSSLTQSERNQIQNAQVEYYRTMVLGALDLQIAYRQKFTMQKK